MSLLIRNSAGKPLDKVAYRYSGQPFYSLHEFIDNSYGTILQLHSGPGHITGHSTGFIDLDHMLNGLQPGNLIVLASRPSMGKSTLALNITQNLSVKHTIPTAIFSLEISKEQLAMRMLSSAAQVDSGRVRTGHLAEGDITKLELAKELLRKSTVYIDDTSGISITALLAKVIRLKVDHDVQVIMIDCLQLMRDDSGAALSPEEVSRVSSSLKVLARELNVSIILLSQLHPSLENRKRKNRQPRLSDLRGTGSLEDDADVILFVYRDTVYCKNCRRRDGTCVHNHEHEAEIIIAKQKNGPIGTVCLAFFAENTSFKDLR